MNIYDTYIIRIYRQEQDDPQRLVGVVETGGSDKHNTFHSMTELWDIINSAKSPKEKKEWDEGRYG